MEYLIDYGYQAIWFLQLAFMVWMLVDAYRRQADYYWYLIIIFVPGVGAWVYFFLVKFPEFRGRLPDLPFLRHRPSLKELRYRANQTPTLTNRLALAERLIEEHEYAEAVPHLEAVLAQESGLAPALYSLAISRRGTGQPDQAVTLLEKIVARDGSWSNYAAWHMLIDVHAEMGNGAKAVTACQEMVRVAPTLRHQCLLAERLIAEGQNEEAARVLERSLEEYQFAPGFIRRRNTRWARQARQLQRQALAR
jgi:hypothetical protein